MSAATTVYTDSMRARAALLVHESKTWTRGRRKADGRAFVLFPSSKPGHAYYTTADACSCPSYFHRGACSHVLAVQTESDGWTPATPAEVAASAAFAAQCRAEPEPARRKGYDELFPSDDFDDVLTSAF